MPFSPEALPVAAPPPWSACGPAKSSLSTSTSSSSFSAISNTHSVDTFSIGSSSTTGGPNMPSFLSGMHYSSSPAPIGRPPHHALVAASLGPEPVRRFSSKKPIPTCQFQLSEAGLSEVTDAPCNTSFFDTTASKSLGIPASSISDPAATSLHGVDNGVAGAFKMPAGSTRLPPSQCHSYNDVRSTAQGERGSSISVVDLPFDLDLDLDMEGDSRFIDNLPGSICAQARHAGSAFYSTPQTSTSACVEPFEQVSNYFFTPKGTFSHCSHRDSQTRSTTSQTSQMSNLSQLPNLTQSSHFQELRHKVSQAHPSHHLPWSDVWTMTEKSSESKLAPTSLPDLGFGLPGSIWSTESSRGWPPARPNPTPEEQSRFHELLEFNALAQFTPPRNVRTHQSCAQPGQEHSCGTSSHSPFNPFSENSLTYSKPGSSSLDGAYLEKVGWVPLQGQLGAHATSQLGVLPHLNGRSQALKPMHLSGLGRRGIEVATRPSIDVSRSPNLHPVIVPHVDNSQMARTQRMALMTGDYDDIRYQWTQQEHNSRPPSGLDMLSTVDGVGQLLGMDDSSWACVPWDVVRQGPLVPEDVIARGRATSRSVGFQTAPSTGFVASNDEDVSFSVLQTSRLSSGSRVDLELACDPSIECFCDIPIPDEEPPVVGLFRATRASRVWTVEELVGGIVHVARDQHGSRFLQQLLDDAGAIESKPGSALGSCRSHRSGSTVSSSSNDWHLLYGQPGNGPVWSDDAGLESPITEYGSDIGGEFLERSFKHVGLVSRPEPVEHGSNTEVPSVVKYILVEVISHTLALSRDVFGNYVIQKLLEHAPYPLRRRLANRLLGHVALLATHPYGCRVVQRALDTVSHDQAVSIASELESDVLGCVLDQNGNHVIQKALSVLPPEAVWFVGACLTSPSTNLAYVARHPYGCRVLQRLLERADPDGRRKLITRLFQCYPAELVCDPYGNYVAQHLVQHGSPADRIRMFGLVIPRISALARHKFGSNVVERLIQFGGEGVRRRVLAKVLGSSANPVDGTVDPGRDETLFAMLRDPYANYVIQTLLDVYAERDEDHSNNSSLSPVDSIDFQNPARLGAVGSGNMVLLESPVERAERKANGVLLRQAVRRMLPALRGCVGAKVWQMLERRCT